MTDLQQMLATLEPEVRDGEYVYVTDPGGPSGVLAPEALIEESEGRTLVVRREVADEAGLTYDFVGCWITLTVHSSLEAVGLTAAFATALAQAGIGSNVLAGRYHDHILVPHTRRDDAIAVLRALATQH
jgi:hypothetical protein